MALNDDARRQASIVSFAQPPPDPNVLVQTDTTMKGIINSDSNAAELLAQAEAATKAEQNMTLREAIRTYPKAVGWSMLLSTAIVMEGFDVVLTPSLYALSQFQRYFGEPVGDGTYEIPASWQAGLTNGALCGSFIGLLLNGWASERFGYRKTMITTLLVMTAVIFMFFFAQNIQTLQAAMVIVGIPWGVFQTLTCTYAAEVCPVQLRAYLTTYVNLCWVMGQMIASGVLRGMLSNQSEWAFRIPYGLQWIWPVPIIVGVIFAPESPWWLVRKNRIEEARKALLRLTSGAERDNFNPDDTIAMMQHTNEVEKRVQKGTSFLDCFKGNDLRRTEIACMVWVAQNLCGSAFMGYSTYFYRQAGLPEEQTFNMSLIQYSLGFIGTVGSWFIMPWFGRRTLYLWGMFVLFCLLVVIGFTGFAPSENSSASWAVGSMLLIYTFVYDITIGPVCYSLVTEIPSTRLKVKTVVLARCFYNLAGLFNSSVTPYMLNPTAWNWGAKTGIFWAGLAAINCVWIYFRLPEPKGRTYGELDLLFENKVSARKFASTKLDPFRSQSIAVATGLDISDNEVSPVRSYGEKVVVQHKS